MSDYEFENFSEGDWDDRSDLAWSEFDWERYLCDQEELFHRYLSLYDKFRDRPDRLDRVAAGMGWDSGEWACAQPPDDYDDDPEDDFLVAGEALREDDEGEDPLDPYTLYRHPIFIATKSLYMSLNEAWERLVAHPSSKVFASLALAYQKRLHRGETHAVFAIHALDMGDYALCVAQLKRALSDLNHTMRLLEEVSHSKTEAASHYQSEALAKIFDLREICLRVIHYCRDEANRRFSDED